MNPDTKLILSPLDNNFDPIDVFIFSNVEIPSSISFGGEQMLAVHQLVGGARVIDAMGRSDMPIEWHGMFTDEEALKRARYLDYIRSTGYKCILRWSELRFLVVVSSFKANFERFYQIPYQISCTIIMDFAKPVKQIVESVDTAIDEDMSLANSLGGLIGDGPLTGLLGTLDTAISAVSTFAGAVQSTINTVLAPIAAVNNRVQTLIGSAGNTVQNVTTIGGILPNNNIAQQANSLLGQVSAMNSLPQLYQLQSVMGRMSTNINTGSSSGATVTTTGGNLFDLAKKAYGSAENWTTIAQANAITDPVLSGMQTLTIPQTPTSTGGVLGK